MSQHHNRPLNKQDYKTLSLAALGGALEFYDFIIFIFFAVALGELFFPADIPEWLRQLQTFGIFAAGYLVRPLGGIIMAHFGDLIGRKKMFSLSILLMALPTLAIGMLPTYDVIGMAAPVLLLLMRIMQGAAIGGEVPGAWVFVAEHVPHKRIGFACGVLTAGLSLGILFGSLVATIITSIYSRQEVLDWAWRLPFFLGGIFGLCAMYLRRWLHETPVFKEMQERKALAEELPLKTVVFNYKRATSISMLLTWLLSAGIVVVILMTPTYMQTVFNLEQSLTLKANSLAIISLAIGCIFAGYLCDKWGAGIVLIIGCILLAATTWFFYHNISHEPLKLFSTYSLTGLTVGVIGATPFVMVKSYPPEVRFSGISFAYNLAYAIFGGLTPIFVTLLLTYTALAPAYYMMTLSVVGLLLGVYLRKKSN
ncbi:MFS transporter [Xenorhabdus griffiniae]|uniref:MFS transporter n=1 Tax=Xenorhabdus griffiniae TaxID=351672 RepID=A0ABY9XGE1_9GAMM|nr:MFS transporter [Xenorhabdus griffiniae]MBD1226360.1 MFS transporter [Xenorhabdus griffiniae]MBE8586475.1 MFS transporter [Xenorhabdus griffiniae]WMV71892.1 MFS transporter [Xenorhabdus griffiniae]WNH01569.1 MFS transporter [Xenorhabdus griffiniae]